MEKKGVKIAAQNRKAHHDYYVEEKYEAGIELAGTEVKSVRAGTLNLKDSYCTVKEGELFVHGMHISPYEKGNIFNKDPRRTRKLLMHKREIMRLFGKSSRTATPSSLFPSTSGAPGSSWRSAWPRARSSTTSGSPPPGGTPSGRWTG